jgi:hypothetical protein
MLRLDGWRPRWALWAQKVKPPSRRARRVAQTDTMFSRVAPSIRGLRVRSMSSLKDTVFAMVPAKQKELKEFNASHGEKSLGNVTIGQVRGFAARATATPTFLSSSPLLPRAQLCSP